MAVMVRLPGSAGNGQVGQVATQVTVAVTVAGVPTGAAKPLVSTSTRCDGAAQTLVPQADAVAPEPPLLRPGLGCGRWRRCGPPRRRPLRPPAGRSASRPAAMINSTNSRNAGTPITASMVAEPRSRFGLSRVLAHPG